MKQADHSSTTSFQSSSTRSAPPSEELRDEGRISATGIISTIVRASWADGGHVRILACLMLMVVTKLVKVMVPFVYKCIMDTVTSQSVHAPSFLTPWLPQVAAGPLHAVAPSILLPTVMILVVVHACNKIAAQTLQALNQLVLDVAVQPAVRLQNTKALERLLSMELGFHLQSKTGALTRSLERGMRGTTAVLSRLALHLIPQALELVLVSAIIGLRAGWWLAAFAVANVALYSAFTFATVGVRAGFLERMNTADNEAASRVLDGLTHVEAVQWYGRESLEVARYDQCLRAFQMEQLRSQAALAMLNWGQKAIETAGEALLLVHTGAAVLSGAMTLGEMVMMNALMIQMMGPLDHLGANYMQLQQGLVDSRQMFQLLQAHPQLTDAPNAPPLTVTGGKIEFCDVYFRYPFVAALKSSSVAPIPATSASNMVATSANDDQQQAPKVASTSNMVLQGLSLTVQAGQTIAIVGESGCGKSTMGRLLGRAFALHSGRILIDGQDVAQVTLQSLRRAVGLVQQEASLFNDHILYNILYGREGASEEEAVAAAAGAQLGDAVDAMPDGFHTTVGERGLKLSGGQRQRVMLARAALKNAPILVCDESTSALDVLTEGRVLDWIRRSRRGRTTLIISHRLSAIASADCIVVLGEGRVLEQGTHTELLATPGSRYGNMWRQQEMDGPGGEAADGSSSAAGAGLGHGGDGHAPEDDDWLDGRDNHEHNCNCGAH